MRKRSFIIEVFSGYDSCVADIWESDDAFGVPLASSNGANPNEAISNLIESLDFSFIDDEYVDEDPKGP